MRFRPCLDLHNGHVVQIVGATLDKTPGHGPDTNYVSTKPPAYYAKMYQRDGLTGGHVIMLGPGNESAAREALATAPGILQVGGGIRPDNARAWLDAGAAQVIVTSWLFENGDFSLARLQALAAVVKPDELVLDLSCRRCDDGLYHVTCDRWQRDTSLTMTPEHIRMLEDCCAEFLVHAVEVEGLQSGIDLPLVQDLARLCNRPVTYAGGIRSLGDIRAIDEVGQGKINYTVGSALDIFGGKFLRYADLVEYDRQQR